MSPQRFALILAGLALSSGFAAAPTAAAPPGQHRVKAAAASCSSWKTITITGGKARYQECLQTVSGKSQVKGNFQLWDTKTDGKNVQAYARTDTNHWFGDTVSWEHFYAWSNTSKSSPVYSSGWHGGDDFELTIQLV